MWFAVLVCATFSFSPAIAANASYTPGNTCSEGDDSQSALLGKHLRVMELAWAPFASVDETAPKGWTGFNIELMNEAADLLGFTYDIVDIGYPGDGETWGDHAFANIDKGDVIMSFWVKNEERLSKIVFLDGHIDVSPGLVGRREEFSKTDAWSWDSLTSFMMPFKWGLWGCLVAIVFFSGVADYVIERAWSPDARLSASLYEYAAGFLWGGFEYPLTAASKVFQIFLGFVLLIIVSTYTANLAAFITLSASPGISVESVSAAIAKGSALCMEQGAYNTRITAAFPSMDYELIMEANTAGSQLAQRGGKCEGVLAPKNFYDAWRTEAEYCRLEIVETLYPDTAGWLGSKNSRCVVGALNYALHNLKVQGVVDRLYLKYFPVPVIACKATYSGGDIDALEEEPETRRRRLESEPSAGRGHGAPPTRRHLKGGSGGGESDESRFGVPRIGIEQMLGLFLLWGILTVSCISFTYLWSPLSAAGLKCLPQRFVRSLKVQPVAKNGDGEEEARTFGPDNEMAFLRALLTSQREMKKELLATAKHVGVVKQTIYEKVAHEKAATANNRELTKMKTMAKMTIEDIEEATANNRGLTKMKTMAKMTVEDIASAFHDD